MQVGEPDRALASGQRALAIATDLGEVGLTVAAQHYLGHVYRSLGDYRRAVECYRKNVACLHGELLHERFGLPGLASVLSRSFLTCSLAECGAFAEGRAPAEEGVRIAEAADHPYSRVMAYWAVGFRYLRQGELPPGHPGARTGPRPRAGGAHPARSPLGRRALGGGLCARRTDRRGPAAAGAGGRAGHGDAFDDRPCAPGSLARARRICWLAVWTRRTPRRSAPWSSPEPIRNGATKPTPCGSSASSTRATIPQRSNPLQPTTARPSPWPRNSACVRSRRTATSASARCTPGQASGSRRALRCPLPLRCTVPWTCISGSRRRKPHWHRRAGQDQCREGQTNTVTMALPSAYRSPGTTLCGRTRCCVPLACAEGKRAASLCALAAVLSRLRASYNTSGVWYAWLQHTGKRKYADIAGHRQRDCAARAGDSTSELYAPRLSQSIRANCS